MSQFADNYGESLAYRLGLGYGEALEPDDYCQGDCSQCDGLLGACTHKCHEMQEAQQDILRRTQEWFRNEVEAQRRRRR